MATVNPYKIVGMFEEAVAEYCGAPYAVAVESCTAAIFLSLMFRKNHDYLGQPPVAMTEVTIPANTYPSVPCSILHSGMKVRFSKHHWAGEYELGSWNIWDAALRFQPGMYHGGLQCLSFHVKKLLPIGRGGMILTNRTEAVNWLRRARFDGRDPVPLQQQGTFDMLGWNAYMQPQDAARGLQLLQALGDRVLPDLNVDDQGYADLSLSPIYTQ